MPNNACKPVRLLSASLRVMSLPLELKASELGPGRPFNQASDQRQIAHRYIFNFPRLNYSEHCLS